VLAREIKKSRELKMKKLTTLQVILLVIFWPVGILYLIWRISKKGKEVPAVNFTVNGVPIANREHSTPVVCHSSSDGLLEFYDGYKTVEYDYEKQDYNGELWGFH
jgi:hypothetical protein